MPNISDELIAKFKQKNVRSLARLISLIEDEGRDKNRLLRNIFFMTGNAYVIGITGAPGAGKSTLVDKIIAQLRKSGDSVGVLAIDPTSPFTGGALLGDRIRMQDHFLDNEVFIRSMGTRGSLGGLARNTKDAVKVLDAYGFDWIIVETVGVGQAELDIIDISDSTMVVLTPGAGDSIQTIKAGIMEIADIFVVNKCDLPGAHRVASEIDQMLEQQDAYTEWRIPVVQVSAQENQGIDELMALLKKHKKYLQGSKLFVSKRKERTKKEILEIVNNRWQKLVDFQINQKSLDDVLENITDKSLDPYTAAEKIMNEIIEGFDIESFHLLDK